jgi:hypothetical protein
VQGRATIAVAAVLAWAVGPWVMASASLSPASPSLGTGRGLEASSGSASFWAGRQRGGDGALGALAARVRGGGEGEKWSGGEVLCGAVE